MNRAAELAEYVQTFYGRCRTADTQGRCFCLAKRPPATIDEQHQCKNWCPSSATDWRELADEQERSHSDRLFAGIVRYLRRTNQQAKTLRDGLTFVWSKP